MLKNFPSALHTLFPLSHRCLTPTRPKSRTASHRRKHTRTRNHALSVVTEEQGDNENHLHDWLRKDLHVVLVHPVIPQNTGSIARTCAATAVPLHLVGPMGFKIDDRKVKRAGLDYWDYVAVRQHDSWQAFYKYFVGLEAPKRLVGFSKFASTHYAAEGQYESGDWLLFGSETSGLPEEVHDLLPDSQMVKIPMRQTHVRSLNLAVSAGIGVFEAIRQLDGPQLTVED